MFEFVELFVQQKKKNLAKLTTKIVISLKKKNKFFECNFFLSLQC